jgi:hypothetical protein
MELKRSEMEGIAALAGTWKTTPGAELEAILTDVDLTSWQDVIQYLRSLGMRENPQIVRMNICLSNDIRITLEGAGVIQAYCRDNQIKDKPFVAMLKENVGGAEPIQLGAYGAKVKLKREIPLAADDARVKEVIARWDSLGKHFRNIQRFEFVAPGGVPVRFDVSLVRENAGRPARTFQEARVTALPARYEVEVELTADRATTAIQAAVNAVVRGISWMLQGRQRSYVLVSDQAVTAVRDTVSALFWGGGNGGGAAGGGANRNRIRGRGFRYPGPQPSTLERRNVIAERDPGMPNIRDGYNVTDKADGLRTMLYVAENGIIFLVDGGGRVYATGKQVERAWAGTVLDGEWIRRDRAGATVSHFYAFDIMALKGRTEIAAQPFMVHGAMMGSREMESTRLGAMAGVIAAFAGATQTKRGVPVAHDLRIGMKTFRSAKAGTDDIFLDAAVNTLEDAKTAIYNTDGLIFTPNAAPLPLGRGTWPEQLKWKPPHENTIDFLVIVDRERDRKGMPTPVEAIGTKYREDAGRTVRYKTLRLFVGSSRDAAFADPRTTVLSGEPLPRSLEAGEWREVEFRPTEPRDPMAATCYVALGEGAMDPAGAAPAALALDTESDVIRATRTGDVIQSDMIVEMAYHPERAPGWRWEPVRVRHDKTERWRTGARGGTMNADWVANSIWTGIHNPVTEDMVRTGKVVHCAAIPPVMAMGIRRAPTRDLVKAQCMWNFQNDFVKKRMLYRPVVKSGTVLCDLAMGRGEDLSRWITAPVGFALGLEVSAANLNAPEDGAYRALLGKMIALGGREAVPPMVFVQADAGRRLATGEAGVTAEDQALLTKEVGGRMGGYDVVTHMWGANQMFRDESTLAGYLVNVADMLKVGGYFIGCGRDGDAIARLMTTVDGNAAVGRDGNADVWMITKRYGSGIGVMVPPTSAGVGLSVDVDFYAGGETNTEFLVSWPYFLAKLNEVGLELLTPAECGELGVPASTQMFSETWGIAETAGEAYMMTDAVRRLSFMNRWWILKRRVDRRPAPPAAAPAPPAALAVQKAVVEGEAGAAAAAMPQLVVEEAAAEAEAALAEGEAVAAAAVPAAVVAPFIIGLPNVVKDDRNRLGDPELADWPHYLTFAAQVPDGIQDRMDPAIIYPSIEAATASAKFQVASGPEHADVGRQRFFIGGAIHQKWEKKRMEARAAGTAPADMATIDIQEIYEMRNNSGLSAMRKYGFDQAKWNANKMEIYRAYTTQRYAKDERFQRMLRRIRELGGEIQFVSGPAPNDMGVGADKDGNILGGENKLGLLLMEFG